MMEFFQAHAAEVFALLFAVSELLANVPQVEANSIFQLLRIALKRASKP